MELIAIILAAFALYVAHGKQKQIDGLKVRLCKLEPFERTTAAQVEVAVSSTWSEASPLTGDMASREAVAVPPSPATGLPEADARPEADEATKTARNAKKPPRAAFDLEKAIGVHLPVWGGALMLVVAGFFLARMAADNGYFTPTMGVIACAVLAFAMLAAAFLIKRFRIANYAQIASALASAAIGTLYATSFLSSAAFGLTSLFTGFILSAGTVALAISIAAIFGRSVLIVGLLGGCLAPFFLIVDAPNEALFHLYLAALIIAGAAICARKGWWNLLIPIILAHFAWLAYFVALETFSDVPSVVTVLSLVGAPLAVFLFSAWKSDMRIANPVAAQVSLTFATALLVIGNLLTGFDPVYLTGFCTIVAFAGATSAIPKSGSNGSIYIAAAGWLILVLLWRQPDETTRLTMTVVTFLLLAAPLVWGLLKGRESIKASSILCLVAAATFVSTMIDLDGWGGVRDLPYLWAALALLASGAMAFGSRIFGYSSAPKVADTVRGIFAASASGYVSLAVVAVVDPDYFALATALQVLGLTLVNRRYPSSHLLTVAVAYTVIYFMLLIISVVSPTGYPSMGALAAYLPGSTPWQAPVAALLLPALSFLAAATVLGRTSFPALSRTLDGASVLLGALALSFLILPNVVDIRPEDTLIWTSLWTNPLMVLALASLAAGKRLDRTGLVASGLFLSIAVIAVTLLFAGLPMYQFWPVRSVPGVAILNVSITGLVVPGAMALVLAWALRQSDRQTQPIRWSFAAAGAALILTGLLVDIRHLFHPDMLQEATSSIERYAYSGGMLLMAFAALVAGTRLDSQPLRYGSLAIMLATVAKIFLFDISGLDGLWRVTSFVAMGVALLATSWFYGRFVFGRHKDAAPQVS